MCDTLCVLRRDGTLFAKASDRPVGEVQVVEVFAPRRAGGTLATQYLSILDHGACAFIGGRPSWLWGVEHGVNQHRVAIGNERVWTKDDPRVAAPALIGMDLVRLGLERARTAEAAVDIVTNLLEELGQGGIGETATGEAYFSSFLMADPREAWIVETSGRTWAATRVDPAHARGTSISNRISIETEWRRASRDVPPGANFQRWRDPEFPTGHADRRIAATRAAACAEPAPDARELAAVLRHHGGHPWGAPSRDGDDAGADAAIDPLPGARIELDGRGVSVCMHLRRWEATAGAMIAALPADPEQPVRAWLALGSPCVSVFVPAFLGGDGRFRCSPVLSDQRTWQRFDALRARVEAARDADRDGDGHGVGALAAIRAVLGPVESSLWHEADEAARGGDAEQTAFTAGVGDRVDAALASLGV